MNTGRRLLDLLTSWSPVLLLGGLAALTFWLDAQVASQGPRRDGSSRHDPDLIAESFRAVAYDADGRLQQSASAEKAVHFPDDDTVEVKSPAITLVEPGKPSFKISANHALVTHDRETVTFTGSVRASRGALSEAAPAGAASAPKGPPSAKGRSATATTGDWGNGAITVATESLRVFPSKGRADSTESVTIEEPRGIIQSDGMEFDNEARTLKLNAHVRGTLQPPPAAKQ